MEKKRVMKNVSFAEQKISLAQTILALNDESSFIQIKKYIDELFIVERDVDVNIEKDFDAKVLTFEEWNKQFENKDDLDEYIPDYGMKLRDFRLKIYNSEREQGMTKKEFVNKVNSWK